MTADVLTAADHDLLSGYLAEPSLTDAPPQDFTRVCPVTAPDDTADPTADATAETLRAFLGWPEWVRLFTKPAPALRALSKLGQARGRPGGILWMAPGKGEPFAPPEGEPGLAMLRGDWTAEPAALQQAAAEARERGLWLVADESTTGFRFPGGGVAAAWDLEPDAALYGEVLGGGALAVLAGRGVPAPEVKTAPAADALAAAAARLPALTAPTLAPGLAAAGARLAAGLAHLVAETGQQRAVTVTRPGPLPLLGGRRMFAFLELCREEGLHLTPVVLLNDSLLADGAVRLAWRRLARAVTRLATLPEGERGPRGWADAGIRSRT